MELFKEIKQEISTDIKNECVSFHDEIKLDVPEFINIETLDAATKIKQEEVPKKSECSDSEGTKKLETSINEIEIVSDKSKNNTSKYVRKPKSCPQCGQILSCTRSLTVHMRVHNGEKPFKCDICDRCFRQISGLKSHMLTHSKEKPYPCPDCDGSFTTSSSLKRHQTGIHKKGKSFDCKYCPEVFYNMNAFKAHRTERHSDICKPQKKPKQRDDKNDTMTVSENTDQDTGSMKEPRIFPPGTNTQCILCGEKFDTISLYTEHKYEHLQYTKDEFRTCQIDHIYPCKICNRKFSSLLQIITHMASHMPKIYRCEKCAEMFSHFLYRKHKNEQHKEYKCMICDQVLQGYLALRTHKNKMHYTRYQCEVCMKTLCSRKSLEYHSKCFHQGEIVQRNHQCVYCHKKFLVQGHLSYHILRYHGNALKTSCDICDLKFEYHYELTRHMQRQHCKLMSNVKAVCHICNKLFPNRAVLRNHIKKHDHKKFQCKRCYKKILNYKNYKLHMKTNYCATKDMVGEVTCKECGKRYPRHCFNRHLVRMHSIKFRNCRFCNVTYKSVWNLRRHFLSKHLGQMTFYCDYCDLGINAFKDMMKHRNSLGHRKRYLYFIRHNIKLEITENREIQIKQEVDVDFKSEYVEVESTE